MSFKKTIFTIILIFIVLGISFWNIGKAMADSYNPTSYDWVTKHGKQLEAMHKQQGQTAQQYCKYNRWQIDAKHYCKLIRAGGNLGMVQDCYAAALQSEQAEEACDNYNTNLYKRLGIYR